MKKLLVVLLVVLSVAYGTAAIVYSENALVDDNGNPSITAEDGTTAYNIIRLKADAITHALFVDGIGSTSCSAQHVDKQALGASATATITAPAAASSFSVTTESTNTDVVYMLPGTTVPTALTGIEILPAEGGDGEMVISALTFLNGSASAAATVTVFWCY